MSAAEAPAFDAIIIAGGKGKRLGGVSKPELEVGGVRLLDRVLDSAASAKTTVVVADIEVPDGVLATMEEPPGSGPAAGLVAGLAAITDPAEWTLVLAVDMPDASLAVDALLNAAQEDVDRGFALTSDRGGPEWLAGIYRSEALRESAAQFGAATNLPVRTILQPLSPVLLALHIQDIDTWEDHAKANAAASKR